MMIPAEESAKPMSRWQLLITCTVLILGYVGGGGELAVATTINRASSKNVRLKDGMFCAAEL